MAISISLFTIVFISIVTGAALPLVLDKLRLDAAHASTSIQVLMDISGVLIVCSCCALLLEGPMALPGFNGAAPSLLAAVSDI